MHGQIGVIGRTPSEAYERFRKKFTLEGTNGMQKGR
jgi:hypothetical protein